MPALTIELKKAKDGRPSLACVRADGSRTWAKVHPFFPTHDLTHCAVESVMGFEQAFFGLIASGWEIDRFAERGMPARMPPEALCAEHIVGHIERGIATDAAELNAALALDAAQRGESPCAVMSESQFAEIRRLRGALTRRWRELREGGTLRVEFPAR